MTGTPGGEPEYFRIHINQYNNVETITCLAKQVSYVGLIETLKTKKLV